MKNFVPLHCHTDYSLLDGLSKPVQIANRCKELGYPACAVTDHGSISAAVSFFQAMKDASIKPIIGCEFYLCPDDPTIKTVENGKHSHLVVLAKNLAGWKQLIKATSQASRPENFYRKPRLSLKKLKEYNQGNFIAFSGHMGSDLANIVFTNSKEAYKARTYQEAKSLVDPDWEARTTALIYEYLDVFGKDNFYLEIQLIDKDNLPASEIVAKILRYLGKKLGVPCVATPDAHYPSQIDARDQRVLLCSLAETTFDEVETKISNDDDFGLSGFFKSNKYHIPSLDEMVALHTDEELENTLKIADQCEAYNLLNKPMLPVFPDLPPGKTDSEYLRQLCRDGWRKLVASRRDYSVIKDEYANRIKKELDVFDEAGLPGYFLIVQDYVNYARSKGWLVGPGRGSGAGALTSYLIGITSVDPIPFDLLFERFYNAGRNTKDRVSYPDIDCDFPISKRDEVISYVKNKYGHNNVSQLITFHRMQGKGALKDVFRAHGVCSNEQMNLITANIPDEAEISDQLEVMRKSRGESSIIQWALENTPKDFEDWCRLKDDGTLEGPMASYFAQAIRLEGTKKSAGKHASGIIISPTNLSDIVPMLYDKHSDELIAGMEMEDMELMGLLKFDILGVAVLDKLMMVQQLLRTGKTQ